MDEILGTKIGGEITTNNGNKVGWKKRWSEMEARWRNERKKQRWKQNEKKKKCVWTDMKQHDSITVD